MHSEVWGW